MCVVVVVVVIIVVINIIVIIIISKRLLEYMQFNNSTNLNAVRLVMYPLA